MSNDPAAATNGHEDELGELVERTRGPQPWRRLFHAASGVTLAWLPWALGMSLGQVLYALLGLLVVAVALDLIRLRSPDLNARFFRVFRLLASPREAEAPASSTWYVLGVLLTYALFARPVAVPAVLVLGLADPAASLIGRRFGWRKIGKGTVTGAVGFFVTTAAVLLGTFGLEAGTVFRVLAVALGVTAVELVPVGPDDNLTIPLATALALTVAAP